MDERQGITDGPDLSELQRNWDAFGREDPMWAVLTEFGLEGGGWDLDAFFESGVAEISTLVDTSAVLGIPLRHDGRALDFGCGIGRLTQALVDVYAEAVGVDIAPSMLDAARRLNRRGDRCTFVLNDRADLRQFDDGSFDCIYTKIVLQHIPPAASSRYIQEFVRLLRPGGVAVFQLPSHHVGRRPLPAGAWRANTSVDQVPRRVKPGATVRFRAVATNAGDTTWEPGNAQAVALGAQWRHTDGRLVHGSTEARVFVRSSVPPGADLTGELTLPAPTVPGRYHLVVDVLQEEVAWFLDHGNAPWRQEVVVGNPEARAVARRVLDALGPLGRSADRARSRVPVLAPPPPPSQEERPVMEMHGIPREEVEALVRDAGGTMVAVHEDPGAPGWVSFTYWVVRPAA